MKITVLTDIDKENSKSYDEVVPQVAKALRKSGFKVSILGVHNDTKKLIAGLLRRKPELVFNLVESFGKDLQGEMGVAALLDLLEFPYTGSGPGELYLQQDKAITKKVLAFHKIQCPDFAVFSSDADLETSGNLRMPLFVKPLRTDASIGIDSKALVRNATEMMERITYIQKKFNDAALVEEFIEGREFYVGVIGNVVPKSFPPIEMDFSGLPDGVPHVLDSKAKWATRSEQYKGTKAVLADLPEELTARLQEIAVEAYRALQLRDYGRVDLRLTDTGEIYVIECNANCYLESNSEFVVAASAAGLDFQALIQTIVESAAERYKLRTDLRSLNL